MIAIACVDLKNGMLFNDRRQSSDRVVRQDILQMLDGRELWMNSYSYGQFQNDEGNYIVDEAFIQKAGLGDYCFVETNDLSDVKIEKLILYRWDKIYPADMKMKVNMEEWTLTEQSDSEGYSHEKITKEVYERYEK